MVEFLDFYKTAGGGDLKYLVFDNKFTTYENLRKLDDDGVQFITLRRRGKTIVSEIEALAEKEFKTVRVPTGEGKTRLLQVLDQKIYLKGYHQDIRQIAVKGSRIKPAFIITNEFQLKTEEIIRKYARRWLVEKTISEQTHFFHLNKVSSPMVIKVDFDLTMTILAHNLYRLLSLDLNGYEHCSANSLYEKFIYNSGCVELSEEEITLLLKKKRNLPALLSLMKGQSDTQSIPWLSNRRMKVEGASHS